MTEKYIVTKSIATGNPFHKINIPWCSLTQELKTRRVIYHSDNWISLWNVESTDQLYFSAVE